jgi:hypothetical protein
MELPIGAGIAVVVMLVSIRRYAARGVAAHDGRFLWLVFLPTLLGGFAILGIGIQMLVTMPPLGIVMVVTGSVYLAALIGFLTRASRSVSSAGPGDDIGAALTQPLGEYMISLIGLVLIGGLTAMVGLVVWAASQAVH